MSIVINLAKYKLKLWCFCIQNSKDLVKKIKKVNNNATGLADRYLVTMGNITHIFDKIKASKKRILFSFCYENVARRVVCEVSEYNV